jgi:phosphoserine aminotransferase
MARVMNFGAGPGALPLPVLEEVRDELLDIRGTGMSILEHSHRGKTFAAIHAETKAALRRLTKLPDTHEILFLQGGASAQFAQVPLYWLGAGQRAGFVINGVWGEKAYEEAGRVRALGGGTAFVAATSREGDDYHRAVSEVGLSGPPPAYVHYTSNETIHGIQYDLPGGVPMPRAAGVPAVCDMSSDFLSMPADLSAYAFAYAGAQKNVGPSGLVVAVVEKGFLERGRKDLPMILRYDVQAKNDSLYNTPPTLALDIMRRVLLWLEKGGGLAAVAERNLEKGRALYAAVDGTFYRCPVAPEVRSVMNAVFRLPTEALEERFAAEAAAAGMTGLKGHRSVGGIRVSMYNAVPIEWVRALSDFMRTFAQKNG